MKFKVEIEISGKTVVGIYYAEDLANLEDQIIAEYPKGRILSILGG